MSGTKFGIWSRNMASRWVTEQVNTSMISYEYIPKGICSSMMRVFIDEDTDTVKSVAILGGCHGNLTAIMRLLKGRTV